MTKTDRPKSPLIYAIAMALTLAGCSTTSNLPEGEQLYIGTKKTIYTDTAADDAFDAIEEEVDAALACPPNGAILGSSSMRNPFQLKLRIYNKYARSRSGFGRWMRNSFGDPPVLISAVKPDMRSAVVKNLLRTNGYFDAEVDYDILTAKNPKKAYVQYTIARNHLYTIDTLQYVGFWPDADSLLAAVPPQERLVSSGDAFSLANLEAERNRISALLRDNGYYYYNSALAAFVADSVSHPGTVEVHLQPVDGMPDLAKRKWHLGKMRMELRRTMGERLTDSIDHPIITIAYAGEKPPIRPRAILRDLKLRPGQPFSQSLYQESMSVLNSLGMFSQTSFSFAPRDTSAACDTLDMTLACTLDKPYDVAIEANFKLKSNDRIGPGLVVGLTKRNVFRGAEKLTLNLRGSYEWQTGRRVSGNNQRINSYEYGADVAIEYPRLETPFGLFRRQRFYQPPSTVFSLSGNVLNRADFFKMITVSGAVTYKFQTSPNSIHEFSPLLIDYNFMQSTTARFDSIMDANPAIYISMRNQFVPKIKYSYTYTSPKTYRHPIAWDLTVTEAGNALSLIYSAAGRSFSEKEKGLFGNPFAQFLKLTTNLRKTWSIGAKSQLVARIGGGVIWAYGNSERAPYVEQFYVGGANSIRAFAVRSIGPGRYVAPSTQYAYLDQTGDIKLEANLEWRFNLFGSLYGALFLDAGNVWLMREDPARPDAEFRFDSFYRQIATATGFGLRYDLDFFVLRVDLGVALHVPYDTGKSGYYNIPSFEDGLGLHLAIGYPF